MNNYTCDYKNKCNKYESEDFLCSIFYKCCLNYHKLEKLEKLKANEVFEKVIEINSQQKGIGINRGSFTEETNLSETPRPADTYNLEEVLGVGSLI